MFKFINFLKTVPLYQARLKMWNMTRQATYIPERIWIHLSPKTWLTGFISFYAHARGMTYINRNNTYSMLIEDLMHNHIVFSYKGKDTGICLTSRSLCNIHQILPFPQARIERNAAVTIDPTLNLCTRYPSLLSGQRQCGFKACPRSLHLTGASGIEPQTPRSRVPRLNRSATCSTKNY